MDHRGNIMKIINFSRVMCLALLTLSFPALSEVQFQGFASFVGGVVVESNDEYDAGTPGEKISNYTDTLEYDKNSVYGLQAVSPLGDGLTATGQLIARGSENYKPEFEWMYMTYNITPTLSAKFGRIRTPFYMLSEYLEVGYTYHWIRPPQELYAAQITNMDGASLLYNVPMGGIDGQFVISVANRNDYSEDSTTTVSEFKSIIATTGQFEMGDHLAKLIYVQGDLTIESAAVTAAEGAMAGFGTNFVNDHVSVQDSELIFTGVGVDLNFHPVRVILEYSLLDFGELVLAPEETRTLASVVYSMGDNAFSYSLSGNKKENVSSIANSATAGTEDLAAATLASFDRDVTTHTLGLRHDFHDSAAVKVELISTEESELDTEATLVRFGVDMLF
jgi:hypothetical protein